MRKFKYGLVALVASAAVAIPAAPASAGNGLNGSLALFEICTNHNGGNTCRDATLVEIGDVTVCGLNEIQIINLQSGQDQTCTSGSEQGKTVKKK